MISFGRRQRSYWIRSRTNRLIENHQKPDVPLRRRRAFVLLPTKCEHRISGLLRMS
jgi:hypothetical protein